jgi:sensor domain CHASE-containing protein
MKDQKSSLSVRTKVMFVIVAGIIVFSALIYALASALLFGSYLTIEKDAVVKDLARAEDAIGEFENQQMIKLSDWAAWDEAYQYATTRDSLWASETVYATGLANLDINGMVWSDTEGEIFLLMAVDIVAREEVDSTGMSSYLSSHKELIRHDDLTDETQGIVMTPEGPMIIVSLPLRTSEGKGPIPGSLTFVRYLNDQKVQELADITHLALSAYRYDATDLPSDVEAAKARLGDTQTKLVEPVADNLIRGYALVRSLTGEPALILRIDSPRPIYAQGSLTFALFMGAGALALALFGIVTLLLIDRTVVARLVSLSKDVEEVNEKRDLTRKIAAGEPDEIGRLGQNISRLLGWLREAREGEAASRREMLNLLGEKNKEKEQNEEMAQMLGKK